MIPRSSQGIRAFPEANEITVWATTDGISAVKPVGTHTTEEHESILSVLCTEPEPEERRGTINQLFGFINNTLLILLFIPHFSLHMAGKGVFTYVRDVPLKPSRARTALACI